MPEVTAQNAPAKPDPRNATLATMMLGGLGLATVGQYLTQLSPHKIINGAVILIGVTFFLISIASTGRKRFLDTWWVYAERAAKWLGVSPLQFLLVGFGLTLSLASRSAAGDTLISHSPLHGLFWMGGVALVILGCWQRITRPEKVSRAWIEWAIVLLLLVLSFAIRYINIAIVPFTVSGDEGSVGLMAWEFASGARNNMLIMGWFSFPAPQFWLASITQQVTGRTVAAMRFPSALGGTLAVLSVYWAVRKMFDREMAIFSALFLAAFHFHVLFSRVALPNIWDGFFLSLTIGALWVAWRQNHRWAFLLTGAAIGFAQFFYTTAHLLPIYAAIWLIALFFWSRERGRVPGLVCLTLVMLALILPLVLFYIQYPHELLAPMNRVSLLKADWIRQTTVSTGKSPMIIFGEQFWKTIQGFTARPIMGVYSPGAPMLLTIPATFFLAGCLIAILRIKDPRYTILIIGLMGPALAGTFSVGAPNAQRLLFATPVIAILVMLPIYEIRSLLTKAWPQSAPVLSILIIALALGLGIGEVRFFVKATAEGRYSDQKSQLAREIGDFILSQDREVDVYFFGKPHMDYRTLPCLPYIASNATGYDMVLPLEAEQNPPIEDEQGLFIFVPEQLDALTAVEQSYPNGTTHIGTDEGGQIKFYARTLGP
jgi:4-amino-4-deoxy-L-arabinose transferase-like glycosyltransferase